MEISSERRSDTEMRAVVNQVIEYKKTLGQAVAASFLAEHYVLSTQLRMARMQESISSCDPVL